MVALLIVYGIGHTIWNVLRQRHPAEYLGHWGVYYAAEAVIYGLYFWILWGVSRSRYWAFVTTAVLATLTALGSAYRGSVPATTIGALVIALYIFARLFGGLGLRPFRRRDLFKA